MRQTPTAMPLVDALKAFACLTIVIHHLCFYRPLTDAVRPWRPAPARSGHAQDTAKTNFHFNLKNAMHL